MSESLPFAISATTSSVNVPKIFLLSQQVAPHRHASPLPKKKKKQKKKPYPAHRKMGNKKNK